MSTKLTQKLTSVVLSATTVVWLSGAAAFLPVAHGQSVADLQAQINTLLAQITALQAQLLVTTSVPSVAVSCSFSRDLTVGSQGEDVKCLQQYLNGAGYPVASSGFGSAGSETTYFGSLTRAAAAAWQAGNNVAPAFGYFGPISRAKFSSLAASTPAPTSVPPGTTPTPVPAGSGLTVALSSSQPAEGLFGESFASRPFTKLTLTASSDGDVVVNALKVQRTGNSQDAVFSGVVALDDNGVRLGSAKTFGSDHTLRLTDSFTVKAGQTRTITLAGDSDSSQDAYAGQLVSLSLIGVETSANVNASYPLTGSQMTVNSTLAVGTLTLARGSFDPGSGQSKEIGTLGYTFSGLRLTAGSNEDVLVRSIRWNQSGSAGSGDLDNVKVVFDGVTYDTTTSSDGKYYTAAFGSGITINKGFNKEMYIKGDIVDGSNRTVDFDLYRFADLQVEGLTYGFGVLPTAATTSADNDDDGEFQDAQPVFDAFQATIGTGSIQVTTSNAVPAQNIAINLGDQPLGAFDVIVKGEPITVAQMVFRLSRWEGTSASASTQDITNVTLSDNNGVIVAGPVDIVSSGPTVTFSDTITFPVGTNTYTLKGKIGTDFADDNTVAASTTPNSDWTTVQGTVSNVTLTPSPSSDVTANTMTVKAGALRVSNLASPVAQTIVGGVNAFTFANFSFDTTSSGEDLRVNSIQSELNIGQVNSADDLTNCQIWDGNTALNTGSNTQNPGNSHASGTDLTFTFDQSLILPKGVNKTLSLKCNIAATTTANTGEAYVFTWAIPGDNDDVVPTGSVSGQTITETYVATSSSPNITVSNAGSLSVALDSGSPAISLASANTADNVLSKFRFTATNEAVNVAQIGLQLTGTASNTPQDLTKVTLWDGSDKVGEAIFTNDNATATVSGFVVPKDGDKILTIKGDISPIGTSQLGRPGHLVIVDYDGAASDSSGNATRGSGQSSGSTIYATPVTDLTTGSNGVRIYKSVPAVAKVAIPSSTLINGSDRTLYRFSVTAPSTGGIGLYKFTFGVATTTDGVTTFVVNDFRVYGYSDSSFSQSAYDNNGRLNSATEAFTNRTFDSAIEVFFDPVGQAGTNEAIQVPAGSTRYFELLGTIANSSATSSTITVNLRGDDSHLAASSSVSDVYADTWVGTGAGLYAFATSAANVNNGLYGGYDAGAANGIQNDFIWSGNSTTTSGVGHYDWVNGFSVSGLPSTNLSSNTLTP
ncbi:MAG: hypothetical protein Q8O87_03350 [bacterium]|nr:hypothetical protein [bacterium]